TQYKVARNLIIKLTRTEVILYLTCILFYVLFFFSSRRRHTRWPRDWSSDVCSSDLARCRQKRVLPREPIVIGQLFRNARADTALSSDSPRPRIPASGRASAAFRDYRTAAHRRAGSRDS